MSGKYKESKSELDRHRREVNKMTQAKVSELSASDRYIRKLEDEIVSLRAWLQRGCDLLHSRSGDKIIDEYRQKANEVLKRTLEI